MEEKVIRTVRVVGGRGCRSRKEQIDKLSREINVKKSRVEEERRENLIKISEREIFCRVNAEERGKVIVEEN